MTAGIPISEAWLSLAGKAKRVAVIAHISPDGDTLGASLALRLAFLSMGKAADVICDGVVPQSMSFLPGADGILHPDQVQDTYDTALAADVSDRALLGSAAGLFDGAQVRLVIDHHATNAGYGDANFIRGGESSCCLLAYEAIVALGVTVTSDMALCLMTGMSTDTGHFQYSSTTSETLEVAGKLVAAGVDISMLTRRLYRTQPMWRVRLTRIAYERMHFVFDGQVGVISLSRADFEAAGCASNQADGLVNHALEVEGVRMAVLASEREEGVKLSLRSVEPDTVNDIALQFGGGGHACAAGCTIHAPLEEALGQVLDAMGRKLGYKA